MHNYQRHPSILVIKKKYKDLNFSFSRVSLSNLRNELKSLECSKSVHETDIPTKVLKENMDNFSPILNYFNSIIDFSSFPNHLKLANVTPVYIKDSRNVKETIDQLVYYQTYQKFFKIS